MAKTDTDCAKGGKINFNQLNQLELAAAHGVSDKTVRRWQKDGALPRNPDGTYNLAETIQWRVLAYDRDTYRLNMSQAANSCSDDVRPPAMTRRVLRRRWRRPFGLQH